MTLHTFKNHSDWLNASVDMIAAACKSGAAIVLAGGNTPKPVYEALAKKDGLNFSGVQFFQTDERYVSANDERSNQGMIQEAIKPALDNGATFVHLDTAKPIPDALSEYEEKIKSALPFSLVVLGMGEDGHVASLFRRGSSLHEETKLTANTHTYEFDVYERLTLTFPAIMSAKKLLLLLSGKKKQEALDQLFNKEFSVDDFPAKKLLEHPDLTIHFADV